MKRTIYSDETIACLKIGVIVALILVLFFAVAFYLSHQHLEQLRTELETAAQKTRLVQTMRSELLASAEAEKSSVMAGTDEASKEFAAQSMEASRDVEKARVAFASFLDKGSTVAERFDDFSRCWMRLQKIDKEVLSLAVQNTDLKALRLSFGPAAIAIRHMDKALDSLMDSAALQPDENEVIRRAAEALTDALRIYALEAPHIADATDAGMDGIETTMNLLDKQVADSLDRLDGLTKGPDRQRVGEAENAYRDFQTTNAKIISLSRENSNVRSIGESLGQKRKAMALCLDSLTALQDAIQDEVRFRATR